MTVGLSEWRWWSVVAAVNKSVVGGRGVWWVVGSGSGGGDGGLQGRC